MKYLSIELEVGSEKEINEVIDIMNRLNFKGLILKDRVGSLSDNVLTNPTHILTIVTEDNSEISLEEFEEKYLYVVTVIIARIANKKLEEITYVINGVQ